MLMTEEEMVALEGETWRRTCGKPPTEGFSIDCHGPRHLLARAQAGLVRSQVWHRHNKTK